MKISDALASGYSMSSVWCLRCDVGQLRREACWHCGSWDQMYHWGWDQDEPYKLVPL